MKEIIKKISLSLILLLSFVAVTVSMPLTAHAQLFDGAKDEACEGLNVDATQGADPCNGTSAGGVATILEVLLNLLSLAVGIVAVIMIIVGGFKYITSQGDSNSVNSAKNTLLYAVIGLVIVAFAQVIVRFVLARATNPPCPTDQTRQTDGTCG